MITTDLYVKEYLFQEFSRFNLYKKVEPDYKIGEKNTDIYLINVQDKHIAIECPPLNLDMVEFRKKIAYYSYKGIYSLWVFSGDSELDKRFIKLVNTRGSRLNYKSSEVERRCHRWYYGRFYYFYNDKIYAVHLYPIERWIPSSCEECLDEPSCLHKDSLQCDKYTSGYFVKPKELREISVYPVDNLKLACIERKDKLRIAKFNEPAWWMI